MTWTPYNASELPNLANVTKRMDPDGSIPKIAEILQQSDPIIADIPLVEGNLPTGHRTTVRADIPTPTWRKLNYGVRPTKSTTAQVDDTIGMLEAYSEIDKDLAMLNGNSAEYRMSEDVPHLEGMSQTMASTIFYGDTATDPEKFLGLSPRYADIGTPSNKPTAEVNSNYLKHVINAGGSTASIQSSVWFIVWGENSVHGIFPKGSQAGLHSQDLGEQTMFDNDGGRFQGFRTHYQWKMGMCVRDWRYIVRIANVELNLMETEANQKALYKAMIKARYTVPQTGQGRGVYYASPAVHAMLDISALEKSNAALGYQNIFGKDLLTFRGTPIKACSAILETESVLT
jgi:hypothetical protein